MLFFLHALATQNLQNEIWHKIVICEEDDACISSIWVNVRCTTWHPSLKDIDSPSTSAQQTICWMIRCVSDRAVCADLHSFGEWLLNSLHCMSAFCACYQPRMWMLMRSVASVCLYVCVCVCPSVLFVL